MSVTLNRLKLIFLGIFVLAAAGVWAYQMLYVAPRKACEEEGKWWSNEWRSCRYPVSIRKYDGPKPPPLDSLKPNLPKKQ